MREETRGAYASPRAAWKNKTGIITVNLRRRHADRFRRGRLAREPVPVETSQICPPRVRDAIIGARAAFERADDGVGNPRRSDEHTSELQSRVDIVCPLRLEH